MTPRMRFRQFIHTTILVGSLLAVFCVMTGCTSKQNKHKHNNAEPKISTKPTAEPKDTIKPSDPILTESAVSIREKAPRVYGNSMSGSVEIKLNNSPKNKPYKAIANVVVRAFQWRPPVTVVGNKKNGQNTNTKSEVASAWRLVGETTTDLGGYYTFSDVITPGYPTFIEVTSIHRPTNPRFPKLYIIADPELSIDSYGGGANEECFANNREERAEEARSKDPKTCMHDYDCFIDKNGLLRHNHNSKGKADGYKDTPSEDDPEDKEENGYYYRKTEEKNDNTKKSEKDPRSIGREYPPCSCRFSSKAHLSNCLRTGPDKTKLTYDDRIIYVIRKDIAGNDVISQPVPIPDNVAKAPKCIGDDLNPIIGFTITNDVLATETTRFAKATKATEATEAVITSEDWYKSEGYTKPYADFPEKHKVGTSIQAMMRLTNRFFVDNFNANTFDEYDYMFKHLMVTNNTLHMHYFPHLGKQPEEDDIEPNTVQRSNIVTYDFDNCIKDYKNDCLKYLYILLPPSMHLNREYGYHYPAQLFSILCSSGRYGNATIPSLSDMNILCNGGIYSNAVLPSTNTTLCSDPKDTRFIPGNLKGDKFNGYCEDCD